MASDRARALSTSTTAWHVLLGGAWYALALVWGGEWLFAQFTAREFTMGYEGGPRWTRTALAFAPFACLALYAFVRRHAVWSARVRLAWATGIALSLLLWLWYFLDPLLNPGGGANIGLGLVMMASPLPIFVVMWLIARRPRA
jgi:hypothetical protein